MSKIVHTEFMTDNPKGTADFIGKMFGWKIKKMNSPNMEYYLWNYPGEENSPGGGIGGLSPQSATKTPHVAVTVDVENIAEAIKKAKSFGAKELVAETAIGGDMGYFAILSIPGGVNLGLWSLNPSNQTESKRSVPQHK